MGRGAVKPGWCAKFALVLILLFWFCDPVFGRLLSLFPDLHSGSELPFLPIEDRGESDIPASIKSIPIPDKPIDFQIGSSHEHGGYLSITEKGIKCGQIFFKRLAALKNGSMADYSLNFAGAINTNDPRCNGVVKAIRFSRAFILKNYVDKAMPEVVQLWTVSLNSIILESNRIQNNYGALRHFETHLSGLGTLLRGDSASLNGGCLILQDLRLAFHGISLASDNGQGTERGKGSYPANSNQGPVGPYGWPEPLMPILRLILGAWCFGYGGYLTDRSELRSSSGIPGACLLFLGLALLFLGPWSLRP